MSDVCWWRWPRRGSKAWRRNEPVQPNNVSAVPRENLCELQDGMDHEGLDVLALEHRQSRAAVVKMEAVISGVQLSSKFRAPSFRFREPRKLIGDALDDFEVDGRAHVRNRKFSPPARAMKVDVMVTG